MNRLESTMIEPQKAMFLVLNGVGGNRGRVRVVRKGENTDDCRGWHSHGACYSGWRRMTDDQIYQCMHWIALEISEFSGVPIDAIRSEMSLVRGYREYSRKIGIMAAGGCGLANL